MALRDISLGCRIGSLSEQSGHGPTCCRLNSVGNDPKRTLAPLSASLSALHYARSLRGHMQRRHFITLLGGTAVGWPLAARAQQPERVRRIGVLMSMAADNPEGQARIAAFHQGLQQSGWTVGHNLRTRWGAGDADRACVGSRRNWSRSRRMSSWPLAARPWGPCSRRPAPCRSHRSGRRRLRGEPAAAGRQRHRVRDFGIRHQREMAGTAQRDRAARDASGGLSGCNRTPGDRRIRRNAGRGAVDWGGGEPGRCSRRRRDRARRHRSTNSSSISRPRRRLAS